VDKSLYALALPLGQQFKVSKFHSLYGEVQSKNGQIAGPPWIAGGYLDNNLHPTVPGGN
jgi:hypothetical protein